jgi:tricorn protease
VWIVTVADHKLQEVAHCLENQVRDYEWSPGSGWLAFSMTNDVGFSALYVWGVQDNKLHQVTSGTFNEISPAWDPKGDYLYFLADHEFYPLISQIEFNFATNRSRGIFALALRKDVKNPFPLESDEVTIKSPNDAAKDKDNDKEKESAEGKDKSKDKEKDAEPKDKGIDFDGLAQRVTRVPLESNNYAGLFVESRRAVIRHLSAALLWPHGRD